MRGLKNGHSDMKPGGTDRTKDRTDTGLRMRSSWNSNASSKNRARSSAVSGPTGWDNQKHKNDSIIRKDVKMHDRSAKNSRTMTATRSLNTMQNRTFLKKVTEIEGSHVVSRLKGSIELAEGLGFDRRLSLPGGEGRADSKVAGVGTWRFTLIVGIRDRERGKSWFSFGGRVEKLFVVQTGGHARR